MDEFENLKAIEKEYYWPVFKRFEVLFVRGEGVYLYDERENEFLDFITGVGVVPLGHANPEIADLICRQSKKLISCSNLFYSEPQLKLAEKLSLLVGRGRWFFSNSGAEAIEAALKIARRFGAVNGRKKIVTLKGSFHGRTFGAMTATGQEKIQKNFGPLLPDFAYVENGDFKALEKELDKDTAAFVVEVIQGENGVRIIEEEFLERAYEICKKLKILFIVDEVQTGLWRTGEEFLACKKRGLEPDVVAIAKGLANGLPIGATWIKEELSFLLEPGDHGSTYGGNALCTAVALKVLEVMENKKLFKKNKENGAYFMHKLGKILHTYDKVKEIRGEGLMVAVEFKIPIAQAVVEKLIEKRILAGKCGETVIRFLPPFIAEENHYDEVCNALGKILEDF